MGDSKAEEQKKPNMLETTNYSLGPASGLDTFQLSLNIDDYLTLSSDMTSFLNMDLVEEVKDNKKPTNAFDENLQKNETLIMEVEDFLQSVSDCSTDDSLLDTDSNFSLENIDSPIELLFEEPSEPSNPEISLKFELPCVKKIVSETQTTIIDENRVEVKKSCLKTQRKVSTAARYLGPYPKEKVERKKAQNRTAAYKYREKKKAETEAADGELFHLQQRNLELKKYSYNLEIELKCLKQLMDEIGMLKGLE